MAREDRNQICTHDGDMLAYLYNEMSADQRDSFELHLEDCETCIDGFAELSQSRYSVYEWKKVDFDPLQTPYIDIPYKTAVEAASPSFIEKVRAAFANAGWATAVPAFGAVLIAAILGFVLLGGGDDVVNNELAREAPTPAVTPLPQSKVVTPANSAAGKEVRGDEVSAPKTNSEERIVPVKAVERKAVQRVPATQKPTGRTNPTVRAQIPTLAEQNEVEDDSLRLSDMFDDIDTSR